MVEMTIGVAAAVAALYFPPAALAVPVLEFAKDKFIERPKRLLLEALKQGGVDELELQDAAEFVPMAYKFLEAAKEGEYEHNLRVLAAFIAQELKQSPPKAMNVKRAAAQIEGLQEKDLQVIALIKQIGIDDECVVHDSNASLKFVSASLIAGKRRKFLDLGLSDIRGSLAALAVRGLLLADGASRLGKEEEYYDVQNSLIDLMRKAADAISPSAKN